MKTVHCFLILIVMAFSVTPIVSGQQRPFQLKYFTFDQTKLVVRAIGGQKQLEARQDSALDILKKRYARGEISREEFENKRKELI